MKITILNERENPLFDRKELEIEIEHSDAATPSKTELQQMMAKETKKEVECVDIRSIFSSIGIAQSKAKVFVWKEKKVEDLSKVVKEKKEEAKEEAQEAPKEEPKEEKKEEKKEDKKETPKEASKESKEEKKEEPKKEEQKGEAKS